MASAPATPGAPTIAATVVSSDPVGTWTHPRFDEIQQRRSATTFGERNVKTIIWNIGFFFASLLVPYMLSSLSPFAHLARALSPWYYYILLFLRLLPFVNIAIACAPLARTKDDLSDIPLTPKQRQLLGLPPASHVVTPGSHYITPPRYSRSGTPRSDSSSRSGSPYSGTRNSPLGASGFSASPLFQKAVNRDASRRLSFGSPSVSSLSLHRTATESSVSLSSPSPSIGRSSNANLPSKWIYEKGRSSFGSRNVYS